LGADLALAIIVCLGSWAAAILKAFQIFNFAESLLSLHHGFLVFPFLTH